MLDIKIIREETEKVRAAIKAKRTDDVIDEVLSLDGERRGMISRVEVLKNKRNTVSEEIARIKRSGGDAGDVIAEMKVTSDEITALDIALREVEEKLNYLLDTIPNIPHESVPRGEDASGNKEVKRWVPRNDESLLQKKSGLDHLMVAEKYNLFDFKRGAKIAAAGFPLYTGRGAELSRASKF